MSQLSPEKTLRFVREMVGNNEEWSDRQLLDSFVRGHDQTAFTVLVRRHGSMVLRVCQHVLHNEHDAEDAFQASFLVLAMNARSIRKAEALASWLHGVAYRTAMKAKRTAARRRSREEKAHALDRSTPEVAGRELAWREVQELLDEEVQQLPDRYRGPFILCCLEGVSRAEAARRLQLKEGTVSSRLAQARKQLQQRLAQRGVTLSAVLGLAALGSQASAIPHRLVITATQAARLAGDQAALTGVLSPQVLALAQGVTRTMWTSASKLTTFLVVVLGLLVGGVGLAMHQDTGSANSGSDRAARPAPPEKPPRKPAAKQPAQKADTIEVKGRVLGSTGKPLAGARIYLQVDNPPRKVIPQGTTDAAGHFQFTASKQALGYRGQVLALAKGHGPGWVGRLLEQEHIGLLTLRLPADDVPLSGRILDLEGQPVAGVSVRAAWVGKHPTTELPSWIARYQERARAGRSLRMNGLDNLGLVDGPVKLSAQTGKDGRFTLKGLGRDRVIRLEVRGPTIEHTRILAVTRAGPARGWATGRYLLYAAQFDHLAAPCKPIVGTVRDRHTGKPVSGITIIGGPSGFARTTTDASGRYRLSGVPKRSRGYWISAGGSKGVPYLDFTQHRIADTPGLAPLTVNLAMERGIEITGHVIDSETRKPIRAEVRYFTRPDNPHLKQYKTLDQPKVVVGRWGETAPDGSFTVLALPGPGVLVVGAEDATRYPILDLTTEFRKRRIRSFPVDPMHGLREVNPSATNPRSRLCNFTLSSGYERAGKIQDPEGNAVQGVLIAGLNRKPPHKLEEANFTVKGLGSGKPRALVLVHPENRLGTLYVLEGKSRKPFTVRLQKLGTLVGQIVDGEGNPLASRKVAVFLKPDRRDYENLPTESRSFRGFFSLAPGLWQEFTGKQTTTDARGRFRIDKVLPGVRYELLVGDEKLGKDGMESHYLPKAVLEKPGQTRDLGKIKPYMPDK